MSNALPTIISDYMVASDTGNVDAIVACFTDDAVVFDEDQEWRNAGVPATRQHSPVRLATWRGSHSRRPSRRPRRATRCWQTVPRPGRCHSPDGIVAISVT